MKKKKRQKNENNKRNKKAVSFLTAFFCFCIAGFAVGIYLSRQETPPLPSLPPPEVPAQKFPERVITEEERAPSSGPTASLKPEDLTFFNTLLDEPEAAAPPNGETPKDPKKLETSPKKAPLIPEEPARKAAEKTSPTVESTPKPATPARGWEAKTPAPKTAPEEPAKSGGKRYRLQIASFALPTEAEQMRQKLTSRGYSDVMVRAVELPDRGTWFRVYLGGYASLEEAQRAEKKVREKDELPTLVVLEKE